MCGEHAAAQAQGQGLRAHPCGGGQAAMQGRDDDVAAIAEDGNARHKANDGGGEQWPRG